MPGGDFSGQDLQGADFDDAVLTGADFRSAVLDGASFSGADLTDADFRGASLVQAYLSYAILNGANFEGADLTDASLANGVDLRDANLRGADLSYVDFFGAQLFGADLSGATLDGTSFVEVAGLTEEMLADGLGVGVPKLGNSLHAHRVRLENFDEITFAYRSVCRRGRGVSEAAPYAEEAGFHPLVILDADGYQSDLGEMARAKPMAARYLQLVACVKELEPEKLFSCGLYSGGFEVFHVRERLRVSIYTAKDMTLVGERDFNGGSSGGYCPSSVESAYIYGSPVPFARVEAFLVPFVGRPTRF